MNKSHEITPPGFDGSTDDTNAAQENVKPLTVAEFITRWKCLDDVGAYEELFGSRLKLAEFFHGQQSIALGDDNPWVHLTDVATVVFMHNGEIPADWDAKTRERVRETLTNLHLAWGEIEPVAKTEVDASPRYLVSVTSVTEPAIKLRPDASKARNFGTKVDREWMTAEQMAATARRFGIDRASYPSPSYAEHVWWVSSKPTVEGVLETRFQLDVHELAGGGVGFHEPTAEDFQRIGDVIGVAFDAPLVTKPFDKEAFFSAVAETLNAEARRLNLLELDQEQRVALEDEPQAFAMLDDMEARCGMDVSEARAELAEHYAVRVHASDASEPA